MKTKCCTLNILVPFISALFLAVQTVRYSIHENRKLGTISDTVTQDVSSTIECALLCSLQYNCCSASYSFILSACHLNLSENCQLTTKTDEEWVVLSKTDEKDQVKCPSPDEITAAIFSSTSTHPTVGDTVSYSCIAGFENSVNGGSITCLADGTWSAPTEHCKKCSVYSDNYGMRENRYMSAGWMTYSPTVGHMGMESSDCTRYCTEENSFVCTVAYFQKLKAGGYTQCLCLPARFEEDESKYSGYYEFNNPEWDEYIRECA